MMLSPWVWEPEGNTPTRRQKRPLTERIGEAIHDAFASAAENLAPSGTYKKSPRDGVGF